MRKKNKAITALLAAFMIMAVFITPITAYANEDGEPDDPVIAYGEEESAPVYDLEDLGELNLNELFEAFTVSELLEMFSMFGGMEFDDDEPNESAIPDNSRPFTPDGQATVVDLAYEGDGKMFYTFKTPAGNVFYLIIDRERGMDNVYFLNAVTEYDLLALAESGKIAPNVPESAIPTNPPSTTNPNDGENPDDPAEDDKPPTPKKSNIGMLIFLLIGAAAVGIAGYYIKIVRPKQQAGMDDEDYEIPDDDGEEMEFEDEPEEADEYEDSDETDDSEDDEEKYDE